MLLGHRAAGGAHDPFGLVRPPQPSPSQWLLGDDAARFELRGRLQGRTTAVQLMFTRCTATCPLQGALFSAVARRLRQKGAQLLSISIDPLHDDAAALKGWLQRFDAPAAWRAAAPQKDQVDGLLDFFRGRAPGPDPHTTQVYLFDSQARLAFRTADMPSVAHVLQVFDQLAPR